MGINGVDTKSHFWAANPRVARSEGLAGASMIRTLVLARKTSLQGSRQAGEAMPLLSKAEDAPGGDLQCMKLTENNHHDPPELDTL